MKHTLMLALTSFSLALVMAGCFDKKDNKPLSKRHYEIPMGGLVGICQDAETFAGGVVNLKKCVFVQGGIPVFSIDEIHYAVNFMVIEEPEQK